MTLFHIIICKQNILKYGKKGGHKTKRYATLFFVAVYFRILHKKILESNGDFKVDVRKLEPIFRSFKLNSRILKLADVIVTKFLEDTVVDDDYFRRRGGFHYIISEINLVRNLRQFGFFSTGRMLIFILARLPTRLIPTVYRRIIYTVLLREK